MMIRERERERERPNSSTSVVIFLRLRLTWWSPSDLGTWQETELLPWRGECCPAWYRECPHCKPDCVPPQPAPAPAWSCWPCWCCAGDCRPPPSPCCSESRGGAGSSRSWAGTSAETPGAESSPRGCSSHLRDLKEPPLVRGLSLTKPHSPEGMNREPEGFLLRQEGAS